MGRAFSGEAAIGDDASGIASNAAILSILGDNAVASGFSFIAPDVDVKGSINEVVPANDSGPAESAIVPYFYATHRINDDVSIGLALHSRFGLSTDYRDAFPGTVVADVSEITTYYLSPKISYNVSDSLTIGAGLDVVYAEGTLSNRIGGAKLLDLEGDDWAFGFNLGVLYKLSEHTRFGLSYHSSIELELEGEIASTTGFPPPGSPGSGMLIPARGKVDGSLDVELPDSIEFSAYHELNDRWAIHGDVIWTNWSTFDQLAPESDNGPLPITIQDYKNAFRVAIGTTYKHNDKWTFRAGLAYDESPVKNAERRTLRIPDADRYWASVGATYQVNETYSLDLGYTHIFAKDVRIDETLTPGANFSADVSGSVNIVGLSINGTF